MTLPIVARGVALASQDMGEQVYDELAVGERACAGPMAVITPRPMEGVGRRGRDIHVKALNGEGRLVVVKRKANDGPWG